MMTQMRFQLNPANSSEGGVKKWLVNDVAIKYVKGDNGLEHKFTRCKLIIAHQYTIVLFKNIIKSLPFLYK